MSSVLSSHDKEVSISSLQSTDPKEVKFEIRLESPTQLIEGKERNSKLLDRTIPICKLMDLLRDELRANYGNNIDFRPLHVDLSGLVSSQKESKEKDTENNADRVARRSKLIHKSTQMVNPLTCWSFIGRENRAFVLDLNPLEDGFRGHVTVGFFKTPTMISRDECQQWLQRASELMLETTMG